VKTGSILFINRVYPPVAGATGQLLAELAQQLAVVGWQVTVVTSGRTAHVPASEIVAGVRIERVGGLPFTRDSHLRRALGYLSLYPLLLWRALRMPRTDVVVTLTDPPLQIVLGPILKWWKGSRLVHWAQDVYPELAEEMGVLRRHSLLARILRGLSNWALRHSDSIIAVGHCMKDRLVGCGVPPERIEVIPNWGSGPFTESEVDNSFRREHGLNGRFVVMYSGNLGLAHPFDAILDAARLLEDSRPEVLFLFVGDGPRLPWVRREVQELSLKNVRFLPPQPKERLAKSLAAADLHLASMREELCGLVVPSKISGVLTAGRPCIFLGPTNSEAAQVILRFKAGAVLERGDGRRLANTIKDWAGNREELATKTQMARNAGTTLTLDAAARSFCSVLNRLSLSRGQKLEQGPNVAPQSRTLSQQPISSATPTPAASRV